jgi:hypothetical protein
MTIEQTIQQKWHMTTYYTCLPREGSATMRCGTHERVLPGGDEISGAVGRGLDFGRWWMGGLVGIVVIFAWGGL